MRRIHLSASLTLGLAKDETIRERLFKGNNRRKHMKDLIIEYKSALTDIKRYTGSEPDSSDWDIGKNSGCFICTDRPRERYFYHARCAKFVF